MLDTAQPVHQSNKENVPDLVGLEDKEQNNTKMRNPRKRKRERSESVSTEPVPALELLTDCSVDPLLMANNDSANNDVNHNHDGTAMNPNYSNHPIPEHPMLPPPMEEISAMIPPQISTSPVTFEEEEQESGDVISTSFPIIPNMPIMPVMPMMNMPDMPNMNLPDMSNMNLPPNLPNIPSIPSIPSMVNHGSLPPSTSQRETASEESSTATTPTTMTDASGSYELAANGRLMESEAEWARRPAVTLGGADGQTLVFRPLRMKCTHCDEAYTKTHDLYAHIRSHQRHTECPHCGKTLTCMATFVYHVRAHTMEKPYYCPVAGCEFRNAVKYNLKVHLACIRHGGKQNLAKYAKVLDLDVCDKSLRKRKDNSVHELGSRRSKKRRKMSHGMRKRDPHPQPMPAVHSNAPNMNMSAMGYNSYYNHSQLQQEEYDQFAAQLLFSLSTMNPNAMPPIFDPNAMAMPQNGGYPGMADPNHSAMANNLNNDGLPPQLDEHGNVLTKNEQIQIEQNLQNPQMNPMKDERVKPEQFYGVDPMYGYYGVHSFQNNMNEMAANCNMNMSAMSAINVEEGQRLKAEKEQNPDLNVKPEPVMYADYGGTAPTMPSMQSMQTMPPSMASYDPTMPHSANMVPPSYYYPNGYYMNYDQSGQFAVPPVPQVAPEEDQENEKKIEVPPLPIEEN